jgi:iron complex outermembrane recepter protein
VIFLQTAGTGRYWLDKIKEKTATEKMARFISRGTALTVLVCTVVHAQVQSFDVPAGRAGETLLEFGRQAHLTILFNFSIVNACQTNAIRGTLDFQRALKRMLEGCGLKFSFTDFDSIVVTPIRAAAVYTDLDGPDRLLQVNIVSSPYSDDEMESPIGSVPLRITSADIRDSGAATPFDLLKTLPENFGGGPTEDTHLGRDAQTNTALGNGLNLRGLGSGATLILVNGRPLAPSGTAGAFTDISNLPLAAIDHIDIASDGGSILYGGSAVGGAVNFVLHQAEGVEMEGRMGGLTRGSVGEQRWSASGGHRWDGGQFSITYQYYQRDPLWASARAQATSDLTPFGGLNFDTLLGNPGTIVSTTTGQTWPIPAGQNGQGLKSSDFTPGPPNSYNRYLETTILPWQDLHSLVVNGSLKIDENWKLFLDSLVGLRHVGASDGGETAVLPVTKANPFYVNPIAGSSAPVDVLYGFGKDLGPIRLDNRVRSGQVSMGAEHGGPNQWSEQLYAGLAFEDQYQTQANRVNYSALANALLDKNGTLFNPFGDGSNTDPNTLAAIRAEGAYGLKSRIYFSNANAQGPVLTLPGGDLTLTTGADVRIQDLESYGHAPGAPQTSESLQREILALYQQAIVPIVGPGNSVWGLNHLDLSTGVRYEHYSNVGQVFTPQFEFRAVPIPWLTLRGSWARLYRPPNLPDLVESGNLSTIRVLPDPTAASGLSKVLLWAGNNADLRPESAKSWTLGLTLHSESHPENSIALTYFNTVFSNLVSNAPDLAPNMLEDPALTWLVDRNVTDAIRQRICEHTHFFGVSADCLNAGIGAVIDLRLHNLATIKTRGVDLISHYSFELKRSTLALGLLGNYILKYAEAQTVSSPLTSVLNTEHNPINLRFRGSVTWKYGGFSIAAFGNYQHGYQDVESQRHVPSWTTADLTLQYTMPEEWKGLWGGLGVAVSALNVLNTYPPFLNNYAEQIGYDEENGDLNGRSVTLTLRKRW